MTSFSRGSYLRAAVLLLIILIGFYLRSIPRSDTLVDPDSYFHYKTIKQIFDQGAAPEIDYSSYYPLGRQIAGSEPPLLPYAAAYTYTLASSFASLSLIDYLILFPAFIWIFNCLLFYALAKKFCGESAAFASTALYAFVPAGIARTTMGHFDKENLALPLALLYLFLFLKAAGEKERGRRLLLSAASGAALALTGLTWGGFQYFLLLSSSVILAQMMGKKIEEAQLMVYAVSTIIALATVLILLPLKYSLLSFKFPLVVLILSMIYTLRLASKHKIIYFTLLALLFAVMLRTGAEELLPLLKSNNEEKFVAEEIGTQLLGRGSNLTLQFLAGEWWIYFQAVLIIAPFGLLLCVRKWISQRKLEDALLIIWAVSSVLAATKMVRLVVLAAPVFSILAACALESAYTRVKKSGRKSYYPFIGVAAGLTLFTALYGGYIYAEAEYRGIPYPYWKEALDWVKENTPSDALIIAYWDKGYWIQAIAERHSFADNSNIVRSRNKEIVGLFCSGDEDVIFRLLARYNIISPAYIAVGLDDIAKTKSMRIESNCSVYVSSWLIPKNAVAAGDVIDFLEKRGVELPKKKDVYYLEEQGDYYIMHILDYSTPEEKEKLLVRLLPFSEFGGGRNLENFHLVYNNTGTYIYEVVKK